MTENIEIIFPLTFTQNLMWVAQSFDRKRRKIDLSTISLKYEVLFLIYDYDSFLNFGTNLKLNYFKDSAISIIIFTFYRLLFQL